MSLPRFAALEARVASLVSSVFGNVHLLVAGTVQVTAVLDRSIERIGEFGAVVSMSDRITVPRAVAAGFAPGATVVADPARYTVDEILSMPRSSWTLDSLASSDGALSVWWLA